ncbi:hypothetical protein EW146_g1510 [Bondarzewia mesenterica]|uniref:Uncharacterized protein n=1 Tax=Bondarzewia mesenterica TaxID=1095465 RepID=A0A4S4M5X0_9AGAM|nr:hypothetical protein EW146_g1510 [Bondarzewia mesenterica]
MSISSVESKKQRYSEELAAYTLRQWNLVRQSTEQTEGEPTDDCAPPAIPPSTSPAAPHPPSRPRGTSQSAEQKAGTGTDPPALQSNSGDPDAAEASQH